MTEQPKNSSILSFVSAWINRLSETSEPVLLICLFLVFFTFPFFYSMPVSIASLCLSLLESGKLMLRKRKPSRQILIYLVFPFFLYCLLGMISSWHYFHDFIYGYVSTQICIVGFLLLLSLMRKEEIKSCARFAGVWGIFIALAAILEFIFGVSSTGPIRISGFPGNANHLGLYLILTWGILELYFPDKYQIFKPVLFYVLFLTLSIGSMLCLAAAVCMVGWAKKRERRKEEIREQIQGRKQKNKNENPVQGPIRQEVVMVLGGFGCGLISWLAAKTYQPLLVWLSLSFLIGFCAFKKDIEKSIEKFEKKYNLSKWLVIGVGTMGLILMLCFRSNSFGTFAERIEMVRNGFESIKQVPWSGRGQYMWRFHDDVSTAFSTEYIHSFLVHIWTELGFSSCLLIILFWAGLLKLQKRWTIVTCLLVVCLIHFSYDTSFFHLGIVMSTLVLGCSGLKVQEKGDGLKTSSLIHANNC